MLLEGVVLEMALEISVTSAFSWLDSPVSAVFRLAIEVASPDTSVVVPDACPRHMALIVLANHVTSCRSSMFDGMLHLTMGGAGRLSIADSTSEQRDETRLNTC